MIASCIFFDSIKINMSQLCCLFVVVFSYLVGTTIASQCEIAQVCVTDLTAADCEPGYELVPNSSIFGCCPSCQPSTGGAGNGTEGEGEPKCRPPANCLPDGRYAAVQCKGDAFTGRCFCSDEDGKRIFGQMWRDQASDMTCACSRRRAELEAAGRSDVTLHCTSSGDYEPLQCDDGLCWCAQPRIGQPTVAPVLQADMNRLPCYSALVVGEQYLRRCESLVYAMALISKEQSEHGTNFLGNPATFCNYDGSYGPYQIKNGIAFCSGRDGENLGSWQIMASEMAGMNCNCALDTIIHFPERGMTMTQVCTSSGSYRPNQNVGNSYYCVDSDGYPIEMLDAWPADNCASHS